MIKQIFEFFRSLTDTGEDSILVHRRIFQKVGAQRHHAIYFSNFQCVRATSMTQRRLENTLHTLSHFRQYRLRHIFFIFDLSGESWGNREISEKLANFAKIFLKMCFSKVRFFFTFQKLKHFWKKLRTLLKQAENKWIS